MHSIGSGVGKTAPKLLQDFFLFDPLKSNDILTDLSPPVNDGQQLGPAPGSCKHEYRTKVDQSVLPPLHLRPDGGTEYKSALTCKKCRIHADVHISFAYASNPCPNSEHPLHHFRRAPEGDDGSAHRIAYAWQCSAPSCGAQLRVAYRLPKISTEDLGLLVNTELLKRRYDQTKNQDPDRSDVRQATPVDVLQRLRRYIKDSLNPEHVKRRFPAGNKRFQEAFGVDGRDCQELLRKVGFRHMDADADFVEQTWQLPNPPLIQDRLRADGTSLRELLEDCEMELAALVHNQAQMTSAMNPLAAEGWPEADKDVERVLSVQGYARSPAARRTVVPNEFLPYFYSLGALPDFADSLIEWAYDRQALCDIERRAYYFECLQVIAQRRGSETLHTKVAILESEGLVSRQDLSAAYRQLAIPVHEIAHSDEERILNLFQVRQSDSGPQVQEENRQALYKIGMSRQSQRLINASRQTLETVEDALLWLGNGAQRDHDDESLLAIASIKVADANDDGEMAKRAISIIARERKSNTLNNWCASGRSDGYEMTPDEALRHLGQEGNFNTIEPILLESIFLAAREDRPGEQTEKAIATLEKARANNNPAAQHALDKWPVGLTSLGNTCYLNSLLQYYFSIKPLREIVLHFEKYQFDSNSTKTHKVGQLLVKDGAVKGSQLFAQRLKHLFERMTAERAERVTPDQELVCRAFLDPADHELYIFRNKDGSVQDTDAVANGLIKAFEDQSSDRATTEQDRHQSDASSVTLHGDEPMAEASTISPTAASASEEAVKAPPLPPRRQSITTKQDKMQEAEEKARRQQDVTEVHDGAMNTLRIGMRGKGADEDFYFEQEDELRDLFKIITVDTAVKHGADGKQTVLPTTNLQINVPLADTELYSSLDGIFDLQPRSDEKAEAQLDTYKSIRSAPHLLQINIPRNAYNPVTRLVEKSLSTLKLYEEIYLDRYMEDNSNEVLPQRRQCWEWRRRLHAAMKERKALDQTVADLSGPAAIKETAKFLGGLSTEVDSDLEELGIERIGLDESAFAAEVSQAADSVSARLAELEKDIAELENNLKGRFDGHRKHKYLLAAVFFHRGNNAAGHYWINIHDFEQNMWRNYNDERVTPLTDIDRMLEARGYEDGTPTFAVYVKAGEERDYIQPLRRELDPEPPAVAWVEDATVNNVPESTGTWDMEREVPDIKW